MKYIVVTMALLLASCSSAPKAHSVDKPLFEVLTQKSQGGSAISFYEILNKPEEIKMLLADETLKGKIGPTDTVDATFLILNMGEKPTSGYSIGIDKVEETPDRILVTVKETSPDADAISATVMTYPYCVVRINSKKEVEIK